jgi:predicted  nucleic acid-binding Zn-ribbon protein
MAVALDAGLLQHLERLDKEVAELNGKLDQAYQDCKAAQSDQDRELCTRRMNQLEALMQGKEGRLAALESKLAGVWGAVNNGAERWTSMCTRRA